MRTRGTVAAAVLVTLGLGLSACSSDDTASDETSTSTTPAASSSATESSNDSNTETSDTDSADSDTDVDVTKPGTKLKFGKSATVPFEYAKKEGAIKLTVNDIEKGSEDDLSEYGDKAKDMTPYFIHYTIENVDGTDFEHARPRFSGLLEDGSSTGVVIGGDAGGKCEQDGAPAGFDEKGAEHDACKLAATTGGAKVASVEWNNDDYQDDPIVWSE